MIREVKAGDRYEKVSTKERVTVLPGSSRDVGYTTVVDGQVIVCRERRWFVQLDTTYHENDLGKYEREGTITEAALQLLVGDPDNRLEPTDNPDWVPIDVPPAESGG